MMINPTAGGVINLTLAFNSSFRNNSLYCDYERVYMISRDFLSALEFRVMDETDKMGFAGVQSPVPLIAEYDGEFLVIIDGVRCEVYGQNSDFGPEEVCEDITDLPYVIDCSVCVPAEGDEDSFSNLGME